MRVAFRREFPILLMLLFAFTARSATAQCTQKLSDLPPAPELLGFRLGMTKDQIKAHLPQAAFGHTDPFGISKTTINPDFDPTIDKAKFPDVRSISLDLLDDHLTSLWVGFDSGFRVQVIEDFAKLVSTSLKLPEAWTAGRGRGLQMKCADFHLIVSTIAGGPSLRVLDIGAEDVVAARRQAKEERDSAVEAGTSEEAELVADKQAKVYYLPTCQAPREISEANKILFKTTEDAEKAGFKLAKNCH